jgi:hypothetical protein
MGLFSKLTGKDRAESWKLLSEEMGAQFIDRGALKGGPKVVATYKNWEIEMDMYSVQNQNSHGPGTNTGQGINIGRNANTTTHYTRIVAPFVKKSDYSLNIHRESGFSKALKIFGGKDIEIGNPEFDKNYRVKSNDEEQTIALFMNEKFSNIVTGNIGNGLLEIEDIKGLFTKKDNVTMSRVSYTVVGEILDHEWLKSLFMMVGVVLDQMVEIGKASEQSVSDLAYSHEDK